MVAYEDHPYPEHPLWRLGPPTLALLLAVAAALAMFLLPAGGQRSAVYVVVLVVQIGLGIGRGWYRRQSARRIDLPAVIHNFATLWTVYAVGGDLFVPEPADSPLATVITGLIWAIPMTILFWWIERARQRRPDRGPRRPGPTPSGRATSPLS